MNILITGSNGFLGKYLLEFLKKDHNVYELNQSNALYKIDLSKTIPKFNNEFDLIIHAAGKAHSIPKSEEDKLKFHEINVLGLYNLLNGLENSTLPKYFVFISSVAVYGQDFGENIDEGFPLKAKDSYGLSKINAERLIIDWCQKFNITYTILRLPLIVGSRPPGNLGLLFRAIKKGFFFNISGYSGRKSMVLAEDIAPFILRVANLGGIFNLTDGDHPTIKSLSISISQKNILEIPLIIVKSLALLGDILGDWSPLNSLRLKKIILDLTFDDSKARKVGWKSNSVLKYLNERKLN